MAGEHRNGGVLEIRLREEPQPDARTAPRMEVLAALDS